MTRNSFPHELLGRAEGICIAVTPLSGLLKRGYSFMNSTKYHLLILLLILRALLLNRSLGRFNTSILYIIFVFFIYSGPFFKSRNFRKV